MDDRLRALIEPIVAGLGCDLWGIEHISQGKYSTLKIYIDSSQGIKVEDCERVSRQVSSMLDVEDPLKNQYTLEVSSPGMDRKLYTLEQFQGYIGENVKIQLRSPFEGRKKYSGQLCGIEDSEVVVRIEDEEYLLPFDLIDRASIIPDFS